jgi:hypothetical protein
VNIFVIFLITVAEFEEYDKQDQQGKVAYNERKPTRPSNKNERQGVQDSKQRQDRAQGRARTESLGHHLAKNLFFYKFFYTNCINLFYVDH